MRRKDKKQTLRSCQHCRVRPISRPSSLCFACYYAPAIRALYPPVSKFARRPTNGINADSGIPEPTDAAPGSEAKIAILEARAARNQALWHEDDPVLNTGQVSPAGVHLGRVHLPLATLQAIENAAGSFLDLPRQG